MYICFEKNWREVFCDGTPKAFELLDELNTILKENDPVFYE